jgi:hypothetical protein
MWTSFVYNPLHLGVEVAAAVRTVPGTARLLWQKHASQEQGVERLVLRGRAIDPG